MTRSTHRILIGAAAASFALLISACGASGGSEGEKETTTTAAKAESTTTAAASTTTEGGSDADAQARADSVDLEVADFPDGWDSAPSSGDDAESGLNDCAPALGDRSVQLARHATDDFSIGSIGAGDAAMFAARTVVFEDEAAAKAAMAPLADADVISCIDDGLKAALTSGDDATTVTGSIEQTDVNLDVEEAAGLEGTYQLSASDGSTLELHIGILAMRAGDIATNVLIQTDDANLDVSTLPVDKLLKELNAA